MKQTLKILKRFYYHPKKSRKSKQINVIFDQKTIDTSKSGKTENNPMYTRKINYCI